VTRPIIVNLLKYLLALGLLGYVILFNWSPASGKGLAYVWQRYVVERQPVHLAYLVVAMIAFTAAQILGIVRWHLLVRAQGLAFTFLDALRFGMLGIFFNTFLPGAVGGDIVKAAAVARGQRRRTVAIATVLVDRIIALWGLVWFVALLGAVFWIAGILDGLGSVQAKLVVSAAGVIVAASAVVWLLMGLMSQQRADDLAVCLSRLRGLGPQAAEFWRAVWLYRCCQSSIALALVLSWLGFIGLVMCFYFSAHALWDSDLTSPLPGLADHFLLVPVGLVIMAVPLLPGGAGIGELGFGLLYGWFGYDGAAAVLGSLVQRVLSWLLALGCYGGYCWMSRDSRPAGVLNERGPAVHGALPCAPTMADI
jgi:glycosyltransferase 2 family protein